MWVILKIEGMRIDDNPTRAWAFGPYDDKDAVQADIDLHCKDSYHAHYKAKEIQKLRPGKPGLC